MQIVLEPVARLQIEMIRRLVQQQQVGLCQQQLGQSNPHLPPARELVHLPRPVLLAESQPGQNRSHLRIQRIPIQRMKPLLHHRVALRSSLVLRHSHDRAPTAAPPSARSRLPSRATHQRRSGTRQIPCGR